MKPGICFLYSSSKLLRILLLSIFFLSSCKKDTEPSLPDPGPNPGDVGKVSFVYRGEQVTYTTVRAGDGNIWSQQNMGASRVAMTMKDTSAYGDFFQWGRWDDGHQVRTPAAPVVSLSSILNNPLGIRDAKSSPYISGWWNGGNANDRWTETSAEQVTAVNGCDPCRVMGKGWRLPTDAEWTELAAVEAIKNSETAYASTLKIPTGGWRSTTDPKVILAVGNDSWYWTSTPAGSSGKGIWILPGAIRVSYSDSRSWGTSIRCIKVAE